MAKYEPKTKVTEVDPLKFIGKLTSDAKRKDSHELIALMQELTGAPPKMWGPTIIGFGNYHYAYASGHEGDTCLTGFSPRSGALVVYLGPGIENDQLMSRLGKHKRGKGCLYINKLDDVDRGILRKLIGHSIAELRKGASAKRR